VHNIYTVVPATPPALAACGICAGVRLCGAVLTLPEAFRCQLGNAHPFSGMTPLQRPDTNNFDRSSLVQASEADS